MIAKLSTLVMSRIFDLISPKLPVTPQREHWNGWTMHTSLFPIVNPIADKKRRCHDAPRDQQMFRDHFPWSKLRASEQNTQHRQQEYPPEYTDQNCRVQGHE